MLEFLTESDVPDSVKDVVEVIGMDAFKSLVKFAGGSNLYIPNESSLVKGARNRMIRESLMVIIKRFLESLELAQLKLEISLTIIININKKYI